DSQNATPDSSTPPPISETPEVIPELKAEVRIVYDAVLGSLSELEQMPFVLPLRLSSSTRKSYWYSSGFGYRIHPITKSRHFHSGLDVATRLGTPVISAAHGVITKVQRSRSGLGNTIRIKHPVTQMETIYGHLQKFAKGIQKGKKIARGEVIGYVGSSGSSTGTHLHYGVYVNGKAVNPRNYIVEKIYY
ncbi:MAG: M23 family metallopeptidase, partial [Candidatus Poribacteria bacterium]|nr:M23 family metallopeptidase [Candidatus Poribacteria bacterium]